MKSSAVNAYLAAFFIFLIGLALSQAAENEAFFEKIPVRGIPKLSPLMRWENVSRIRCALECTSLSECRSISHRRRLQRCSLYGSRLTMLGMSGRPSPDEETIYWKRIDRCPPGKSFERVPGTNKCLRYGADLLSRAVSERTCQEEGGHLAIIEDMGTWGAVRSYLEGAGVNASFIHLGAGLTSRSQQWLWLEGSLVEESFWSPGQPDNGTGVDKCLYLNWQLRDFEFALGDDGPCSFQQPYLCEF